MLRKTTTLTLLALVAGICLDAELSAWSRKPMDSARCKQEGKTMRRCIKENTEDNEYIFGTILSTQSFKVFNDFSAAEKQRAMDYADNNQMDPDAAVAKVSGQPVR